MTLIKCTKNDLHKLQRISRETFKDTFSEYISEQDIKDYFATALRKEKLLSEIEDKHSSFYFACHDEEMVGYMKVNETPAQTEINDAESLELQRIYLLKHRQGKGEGAYLLNHAINIARDKAKKYLWLGVWENNHRAIKFYKKYGFYAFSEHFFIAGSDKSHDILMRLDL